MSFFHSNQWRFSFSLFFLTVFTAMNLFSVSIKTIGVSLAFLRKFSVGNTTFFFSSSRFHMDIEILLELMFALLTKCFCHSTIEEEKGRDEIQSDQNFKDQTFENVEISFKERKQSETYHHHDHQVSLLSN